MIAVYTRSPINDIETMVEIIWEDYIVWFLDEFQNQSSANNLRKKFEIYQNFIF